MKLNTKLCYIIDSDKGYCNQGLADKIEKLFEEEIQIYKDKAIKWDKLENEIARCYVDENGDELSEEELENIDLVTIGEIAMNAFG